MRAHFILRTAAALVDTVICIALIGFFTYLYSSFVGMDFFDLLKPDPQFLARQVQAGWEKFASLALPYFITGLIEHLTVLIVYFVSLVIGNATPGMFLFGLRLGRLRGDEARVIDKVLRFLIVCIPFLFKVLTILAMIILFRSQKAIAIGMLVLSLGNILVGIYCIVLVVGFIGAFFESRLCLHDIVSNTAIYVNKYWDRSYVPKAQLYEQMRSEIPKRNPAATTELLFK